MAEREIRHLKYGGLPDIESGRITVQNRRLMADNAKLTEDLKLAEERLASSEMARKRTIFELQASSSRKRELEAQKELMVVKCKLNKTAVQSQETSRQLERNAKDMLRFQKKSASTIENLNAELQQAKLALTSALAESDNREKTLEQAHKDLALQKQCVDNTLTEILQELKDVKERLAMLQLQQSNTDKDAAQKLDKMQQQLDKKEADLHHAKVQWQGNYDYIQWMRKNYVEGEKYEKALAEIENLKKNTGSNEDYQGAQAEIQHLKQNGVSRSDYDKAQAEIEHLKQTGVSRSKYEKAQAEIEHLKQNGVPRSDYDKALADIQDLKQNGVVKKTTKRRKRRFSI
jgi:hypothetical protein